MTDFADRVRTTIGLLLAAIGESGIAISGDQRISEADAARLLGFSADRLKQMRHEGLAPPSYHRGVNGARRSYRVDDLACWLEEAREDW